MTFSGQKKRFFVMEYPSEKKCWKMSFFKVFLSSFCFFKGIYTHNDVSLCVKCLWETKTSQKNVFSLFLMRFKQNHSLFT